MCYNNLIKVVLPTIIGLVIYTTSTAQQTPKNLVKWVVEKNSTLRVEGESNVNKFTCNINEYAKRDTIFVSGNQSKQVKLSGRLQMNVMDFNCHNSLITKDLRKTLKSKEYPKMNIHFLSLECMPGFQSKCEYIKGWVEVELAGVRKRFEMNYTFSKDGTSLIKLNGGRNFCFSDFKLSPPQKLAGLIKIKDEFDVNFQLVLRII
ncbi:MAG: hypothetical protein JWQ96_578 [Segetibacter sp.]|nr:hypothetical protein [Segetibacter sp.]